MNSIKRLIGRSGSALTAFAFAVATVAPVVISGSASAAGQFSPRKLTMSSQTKGDISTDANAATVAKGSGGNGAFARHTFDFSIGTAGTVQSVLLQYCTTPLLDTTCVAPTGLNTGTVASVATQSGGGAQPFTLDTTTSVTTGNYFATYPCTSRAHCITLQRASGTNITAGQAISLAFGQGTGTDWIQNPTAVGTFYVRIYTFSNTTYTTASMIDAAAVAGSVNENIDITAKVQEKLNFSVSAAKNQDPGAGCAALTGTGAITLGSGGVLDTSVAYDNHTYFRLSTNAANGTVVSYTGDTLKTAGGTNSIAAALATGEQSKVGTSQFGLGIDTDDTTLFGHSFTNLVATSPYAAAAGTITNLGTANFAFNTASMTSPVQIASATTGTTVACDTGSVRYVANISPVTKPGVYKTTIGYIATPTF
ncbi:MAG TPA: hypothetical protein VF575_03030 [Candidatus Saccharimonadales bacterium]|jgi:hypothetical protein